VSQKAEPKTNYHTVAGSIKYFAPEVLKAYLAGKDATMVDPHKCDVFSLGLVFLRCLSLEKNEGWNKTDNWQNWQKKMQRILWKIRPQFNRDFGMVISKMLEVDPNKRITIEELQNLMKTDLRKQNIFVKECCYALVFFILIYIIIFLFFFKLYTQKHELEFKEITFYFDANNLNTLVIEAQINKKGKIYTHLSNEKLKYQLNNCIDYIKTMFNENDERVKIRDTNSDTTQTIIYENLNKDTTYWLYYLAVGHHQSNCTIPPKEKQLQTPLFSVIYRIEWKLMIFGFFIIFLIGI